MLRHLIALLVVVLSMSAVAQAKWVLPRTQWTTQSKLWLSRAMVAEAGWKAETDHIAIAYVLARRWEAMKGRYPKIRFLDMIRAYCAGLEPTNRTPTPRQKWVRSLSLDMSTPDNWPSEHVSWERHKKFWKAALNRSDQWVRGKLVDPCNGEAWHWGGSMDIPGKELYPVDCGETLNVFYGIRNLDKEENDAKSREKGNKN